MTSLPSNGATNSILTGARSNHRACSNWRGWSHRKTQVSCRHCIDQFRYDYLERFGDLFDKGGFRRLMQEGAVFTDAGVIDSISTALIKRFGPQKWVLSYVNGNLYLDSNLASRQHIAFTDLMRAAAGAALALPQFAAAYTADDFAAGHFASDEISQRVARNFFAGRSGDVFLIPKPSTVAPFTATISMIGSMPSVN